MKGVFLSFSFSSLFEIISASGLNIGFNFPLSHFSKVIKLTPPSNMSLVALKNSRRRKVGKRKIAFVKFSLESGCIVAHGEKSGIVLSLNVGEIYGEIFYLHFGSGVGKITISVLRERLEEDFRNRV